MVGRVDIHRIYSVQVWQQRFHVQVGDNECIWNGAGEGLKIVSRQQTQGAGRPFACRLGAFESAGSRAVIGRRSQCPRTRRPEKKSARWEHRGSWNGGRGSRGGTRSRKGVGA